jgi:Flp pilus assembly protein TadD
VILNEGIRHARSGRYPMASSYFTLAASFPATRAEALFRLGNCELQQGRVVAATRSWKAAALDGQSEAGAALERLRGLPPGAWSVLVSARNLVERLTR